MPASIVSAARSVTNTYDELPYDSNPFSQTHPSRLATVATLFGLTPAPVEKCRVLELGCAAGGNITPLAELYPESEFVGVDLSARQVAEGEQVIQNAGLKNIKLRHASILDIDESYGTFDYIICHGVFSWVPDPVRQKILAICSANLNPTGVAYVSYNTYPGWHMRGMIRDMMRFHSGRFDTAIQKVEQARALLDFLAQSAKDDTGPYGTLLRQELEGLRHQSDNYLYHDHLEEVNDPVYFHQFIEMAHKHNVRYLGEARLPTMVTMNFSPDVRKAIAAIATDQIQIEQYLDFVRNRTFRETLLVRPAMNPNWAIRPEAIRKLHITLPRRPNDEGVDVKSNTVAAQYTTTTGMTLTTTNPILKAAMRILGQKWPGTMSFADLDKAILELLDMKSDDGQQLAVALLNTYLSSNLIEFHSTPIPQVSAKERPIVLGVARARIELGQTGVATRRHEFFRTNDLDKRVIPMLDGTRDRDMILDKLVQLSVVGELQVNKDGQRVTDPTALRAALGPAVENALERYATSCLLKE
ncbi:MAG: class I SAM-dependent methyltransferase [Planctomycetes bacterium]|nr:class I SAM-dependent methyltransferase [Planctomycetota bacterium]